MQVRSLGYRTDLIFPRFDGLIEDRSEYLVIRTPTNPLFYWGNFLLFSHSPRPDDFQRWQQLFAQEIRAHIDCSHQTFGWDSPEGELGHVGPFLDAGFHLMQNVILSTRQVLAPPKYNDSIQVRAIQGDAEWQQVLELKVLCFQGEHNAGGFLRFAQNETNRFRAMVQAGLGQWFGAFLDNHLVGNLGLFRDKTIGRFQDVGTHPGFRRQGICGTLVYQASSYAFAHMDLEHLVMAADEHYHAAAIYESVGFRPTERQVGLEWWDKNIG
jgi:RimJ/RimL family protein N-acetyltransferase